MRELERLVAARDTCHTVCGCVGVYTYICICTSIYSYILYKYICTHNTHRLCVYVYIVEV